MPLQPIGDRDPVNKGMAMKFGIQQPVFEAVDAGGGGGQSGDSNAGASGAGGGNTGATGTGGGNQGTQTQGNAGTGQQQGNPGQAAAKPFSYNEDRTDWVPRHRLNDVTGKYRNLEGHVATLTRQIQALTGAQPPNPADAEAEQVRGAFKQMFPHLGKLTPEQVDRLVSLAENGDQITETTNNYWRNVGTQMVSSASEQIADALGVDSLTPSQARRVSQAYVAMLSDDFQQARSEGRRSTLLQRHEGRDPKLIEEFVKQFTEDFITPVQRRSVQTNVERVSRRVPSGRGTQNAAINSKPKIDFNDENAVADAAVASFAAHGGLFGKR